MGIKKSYYPTILGKRGTHGLHMSYTWVLDLVLSTIEEVHNMQKSSKCQFQLEAELATAQSGSSSIGCKIRYDHRVMID